MKLKLITAVIFLGSVFLNSSAYSFWIWSTKTQKWKNPEYSPLASPKMQMDRAMSFYKQKDYKQALVEFRKLVIHYPDSKQAPQAQYYVGRCFEKLGQMYRAFEEYQKVIDSYPYSTKIEEIVGRQYKIGEFFLNKQKKKILGIAVDDLFEHPSIEIFKKVISNSPYSEYAVKAQYKLGLLYANLGRFSEAVDSFKSLIEKHPESKWAEPAKYQLALTSAKASLGTDYDQEYTQEAKERFKEFVAEHPDAKLSSEALERLGRIRDKEAKKQFDIAEFYKRQKKYKSAAIYYKFVADNFSQTLWAEKSRDILRSLKDEGKI